MYEYRDYILEKIKNKEDLTRKDIENIEIALTMSEAYESILNVAVGCANENEIEMFPLNYTYYKSEKEADKEQE